MSNLTQRFLVTTLARSGLRPRTLALGCGILAFAACRGELPMSPQGQPAFAPAENKNKLVIPLDDISFTDVCPGGETLNVQFAGWLQIRFFDQPNNKNVELDIVHNTVTFTNATNESFVIQVVGPDRYYLEDGKLFVAIVGRGTEVFGRVVVDLSTDPPTTVFVAGKEIGHVLLLACEALT
jgi:hypothetical protein